MSLEAHRSGPNGNSLQVELTMSAHALCRVREKGGSRKARSFSVGRICQDKENLGGEQTWQGTVGKNPGGALTPALWGDAQRGMHPISTGRCREVRHSPSIGQGPFLASSDLGNPSVQRKGHTTFAPQN